MCAGANITEESSSVHLAVQRVAASGSVFKKCLSKLTWAFDLRNRKECRSSCSPSRSVLDRLDEPQSDLFPCRALRSDNPQSAISVPADDPTGRITYVPTFCLHKQQVPGGLNRKTPGDSQSNSPAAASSNTASGAVAECDDLVENDLLPTFMQVTCGNFYLPGAAPRSEADDEDPLDMTYDDVFGILKGEGEHKNITVSWEGASAVPQVDKEEADKPQAAKECAAAAPAAVASGWGLRQENLVRQQQHQLTNAASSASELDSLALPELPNPYTAAASEGQTAASCFAYRAYCAPPKAPTSALKLVD